jgi:hypothetical protein
MAYMAYLFRPYRPFKKEGRRGHFRPRGHPLSALYLFPFPFYLSGMSDEQPPYSPVYIKAWALLSITVALIFLGMFFLGNHLLNAGHSAWDLVRWLARPII